MPIIKNNTKRQYNLKCVSTEGSRFIVRLTPGLNDVATATWINFVPSGGKAVDPYVARLRAEGLIDYGKHVASPNGEDVPAAVSKVVPPLAKPKSP